MGPQLTLLATLEKTKADLFKVWEYGQISENLKSFNQDSQTANNAFPLPELSQSVPVSDSVEGHIPPPSSFKNDLFEDEDLDQIPDSIMSPTRVIPAQVASYSFPDSSSDLPLANSPEDHLAASTSTSEPSVLDLISPDYPLARNLKTTGLSDDGPSSIFTRNEALNPPARAQGQPLNQNIIQSHLLGYKPTCSGDNSPSLNWTPETEEPTPRPLLSPEAPPEPLNGPEAFAQASLPLTLSDQALANEPEPESLKFWLPHAQEGELNPLPAMTQEALLEPPEGKTRAKKPPYLYLEPLEPTPTDEPDPENSDQASAELNASSFQGGAELILLARNLYLRQNPRLFNVVSVLAVCLLLMVGLFFYLALSQPEPKYFAVTPDLRLLELTPLNEPYISAPTLIDWTSQTVTSALSLDFLHWRRKLMAVKENFSENGFNSFVNSLKNGGHIKKIESDRLNLSCALTGAPVIVNTKMIGSRLTWKLELPVLVSYQSSNGVVASQNLIALVTVQRADTTQKIKGVEIKQIVLSKKG
jgi:intracellular multiplication protein IcmL